MNRWHWLFFFGLVVGVAAGCERGQPPGGPGMAGAKTAEVQVCLPERRSVRDFEEFTGRVEAVSTIEIKARVTGYLNKVDFRDGAEVKEGDVLFEIDPRTYEAELARAEAQVVQADARLTRLNADFNRANTLVTRNGISREEFDRINGDRAEAAAAVIVTKAARDLSKLNVGFTKVKSPIDGRISRRYVDPGNLVKADETSLTSVVSLDPMYVVFDIDERTMLQLRRLLREGKLPFTPEQGVDFELGLADEEGFPHKGKINFEDNKLDPSTGTLRYRGEVPNPRTEANGSRILAPGLFVRCRLPVGDPHPVLLVPEQALGTDQGRKFIYVVVTDKDKNDPSKTIERVEYRHVQVGKVHNGWRVIDTNLKDGERVVISGLQRIRDKAEVNPKLVDLKQQASGKEAAAARGT